MLTATVDGVTCTHTGTMHIVEPPVVTSVRKLTNPFRLKITGSRFEDLGQQRRALRFLFRFHLIP